MPKDVDLVAAQQASMEADVGSHPGPMFRPTVLRVRTVPVCASVIILLKRAEKVSDVWLAYSMDSDI